MNASAVPPDHVAWLKKVSPSAQTADGTVAQVWEFDCDEDPEILSEWAKHFRNHYCCDDDIDFLKGDKSRTEYLNDLKFPTKTGKFGPPIRAGDFGEILVADLLQWLLGFWVPRVRWNSKVIRDESVKGSDLIGFQFESQKTSSSNDVLAVFEAKTKFSKSGNNKLQDAINDSAKDYSRIAESLNFIKQKMYEKGDLNSAQKIDRFQTPVDKPYRSVFGAAAIIDDSFDTEENLLKANANETPYSKDKKKLVPHPNIEELNVIVIKGSNMMQLVHKLYKLAADEA